MKLKYITMLCAGMLFAVPGISHAQFHFRSGKLEIGPSPKSGVRDVSIDGLSSLRWSSNGNGTNNVIFRAGVVKNVNVSSSRAYIGGFGNELLGQHGKGVVFVNPTSGQYQSIEASDILCPTVSSANNAASIGDEKILDMIGQLTPVTYRYTGTAEADPNQGFAHSDSLQHFGFAAQEVESVLPTLVSTDIRETKTIDQSAIVSLLFGAVNSLSRVVRDNEASLASLAVALCSHKGLTGTFPMPPPAKHPLPPTMPQEQTPRLYSLIFTAIGFLRQKCVRAKAPHRSLASPVATMWLL